MWDPSVYGAFAGERSRPFFDLTARIGAESPRRVVDLGCGPGELTVALAARWPDARVTGVDSSPEMIGRARALASAVDFVERDVGDFLPDPDTDVLVSNATLQWVPGHPALLERWAGTLSLGGWLALQVPGNFDAPSHRALRELAGTLPWRERLAGVLRGESPVLTPDGYVVLLERVGGDVDAWETTYLHRLPATADAHPVLTWMEGTALRPVRSALDDREWASFRGQLEDLLRDAYPTQAGKVTFPFRRIFAVARFLGVA